MLIAVNKTIEIEIFFRIKYTIKRERNKINNKINNPNKLFNFY